LAILYVDSPDKNYGTPNPKQDDKIMLKGGRPFRSLILKMVSQCEESEKVEEEFIRKEQKWKLIFKFVHFGESKNMTKYPIAFKYANRICNATKISKESKLENSHLWKSDNKKDANRKDESNILHEFVLYDIESTECMSTITGKVNKYIETHDEQIFDYLLSNPGLAFRLMRRISLTFQTSDLLIPFLKEIIPKMNFDQQVDLFHIFSSSDQEDHPDVVITSKGTIHWGKV
jgi:hypothetical protein